jgi:hypothetical protein
VNRTFINGLLALGVENRVGAFPEKVSLSTCVVGNIRTRMIEPIMTMGIKRRYQVFCVITAINSPE